MENIRQNKFQCVPERGRDVAAVRPLTKTNRVIKQLTLEVPSVARMNLTNSLKNAVSQSGEPSRVSLSNGRVVELATPDPSQSTSDNSKIPVSVS